MALRFETSGSVRRPAPTNCPAGGRLPPLANRAAWRSEGRRHISNGRRSIPSLPGKLSAEGRRMRRARLEARVIGGRPVEGRRAYRQRANHSSARPLQTRAAESLPGAPRPEAPKQIRQRLRRGSPSGFARKWRRKGLKRLNPRPEMVWPRERRTHNIWYNSATALAPPSRATNAGRGRGGRKFSWLQSPEKPQNAERISPEPGHGITDQRRRR